MTPHAALAAVYGKLWADSVIATLRRADFIIVDRGAIGRAQREAVAQFKEDVSASNDAEWTKHGRMY